MLQGLIAASMNGRDALALAGEQVALWDKWLLPIGADAPAGKTRATTMIFSACAKRLTACRGLTPILSVS